MHLPARIELRLREPEEHHEREGRERRSSGIMRCEKLGPHDCSLHADGRCTAWWSGPGATDVLMTHR